jgi:putative tryptophan/tyrosine transport system substrate-binding protein
LVGFALDGQFCMRRRNFIALLGGAAAWPLTAQAQQAGKLPTIGFLSGPTASAAGQWVTTFKERLRELGWIEGRTVAIEYRWADAHDEPPLVTTTFKILVRR